MPRTGGALFKEGRCVAARLDAPVAVDEVMKLADCSPTSVTVINV
jgi:hypothetical protein